MDGLHVVLLLGRLLWHRTEQKDYTRVPRQMRGTVGTVQGKQRVGDQDRDVGRQDGPSTHMDGPPRHGTESVPSRLRLPGCWSLLAAEPAVHEDHTRRLSQIPHHFWFWAPTDTRFGRAQRGAPGAAVSRTRHVRVRSTGRLVYVHACTLYGVISLIDQSAGHGSD